MRKSNLRIKCLTIILIFIYSNAFAFLPFVKNLHKKCLSNHQDCALGCAAEHYDNIQGYNISPEAAVCAQNCINDYRVCEETLAKMRYLNEVHHFELEDSKRYKPLIDLEDDYE